MVWGFVAPRSFFFGSNAENCIVEAGEFFAAKKYYPQWRRAAEGGTPLKGGDFFRETIRKLGTMQYRVCKVEDL
jgi:hypothetical protein